MLRDVHYQPKAIKILKGTIKKERLPTAILMYGQKGVGKMFTALNYAKAINCHARVDFDCCDRCISCKKIDGRVHPDVHLIEAIDSEIKIDSIRKIEEFLSFKPLEGREKVVIVNDSERMNQNASNAFLKILEEPPPNSLLILISSNEDALPLTIKSRCIPIPFSLVPSKICREFISSHTSLADIDLSINLAMGRPWIAIERNFEEEKKLLLNSFRDMINDSDTTKETWSDNGEAKYWFDLSFVALRDMLVYKITQNKEDMLMGEIFKCKSFQEVLNAYDQLQGVYTRLDFNLNKAITWNYISTIIKSVLQ
ncbi:MAG: DNA polymerase III subunit [Thermodesulfovibrionales bacterium]|nr:DNA polymerase III subunit [Thermodesulfovibrionales bacterium]